MKTRYVLTNRRQSGFSMIELMLVIAILSIVVGAVFLQLSTSQQRLSTEETRLDDFQQARDFVDQFFRDINEIGTPNMQIMDTSQTFSPALTTLTSLGISTNTWSNPYIADNRFAMGLTKINNNEIHFEGSVNGDGTVQSIVYMINGSGSCQLCMQRSQVNKVSADPLTGQSTNWGTEVNDITTTNVFSYFQYDGTQISFASYPNGIDYTSNAGAQLLANVKTIQINLTIQNNKVWDQQTQQPIQTSFEGEVSLNNCSMAATGQNMSCQ